MVCDDKAHDWDLLQAYATHRSEAAFTQVVERHLGFVYSTALRQVRDVHLAEDVTQAVFVVLARKAHTMRKDVILSSWLFRTVRYAASDALKRERRRAKRELAASQEVVDLPELVTESQQVAPQLDEALASLSEADRRTVLLRFFEQKSIREVGEALCIQEETAKKRITRAVEKLRVYFVRKGTAVSAGVLLAAIASESVRAAPPGLVGSVVSSATGHAGAMAASTMTLADAIMSWMLLAKLKLAGLVSAAVLLSALGILALQPSAPVATYDLSREFSQEQNPNGPWSYGSMNQLGGQFTPLAYHRSRSPASWEYEAGLWPAVYQNNSTNTLVTDHGQGFYPPGSVWLAAGDDGTDRNFVVVRLTIPPGAGAEYRIESRVKSGLIGSLSSDADFHVVRNGVPLFGVNREASATEWLGYTNTVTLAGSDTVDFLVGRGADGIQRGSVLLMDIWVTRLSTHRLSTAAVRRNSQSLEARAFEFDSFYNAEGATETRNDGKPKITPLKRAWAQTVPAAWSGFRLAPGTPDKVALTDKPGVF